MRIRSRPGGTTFETLRLAAQKYNTWICAGLVERAGECLFNSAVLIDGIGNLRLLHRKLNELDIARSLYATGDRLGVVETAWGRIGLMICADAFADNFPVSRALGLMGAKLILSPCAWAVPAERNLEREPYGDLWKSSYGPVAKDFKMTIAGCSSVGPIIAGEWKGWRCIGNSLVVGPDGNILLEAPGGEDQDVLLTLEV